MSQNRFSLASGAILMILASAAYAEIRTLATAPAGSVPGGIHYQGRLEDSGIPAQGTRSMRFRLYDAATAGTLLWDSGATAVAISQGIFGTDLAIPVSALSGAAVKYLEVEIEGAILSPREAVGTVPYALIAKTIEGTIDVQNGGLSISSAPTSTNPSVFVSPTTGDVGIGTSSPGASLEVRNTGGTQVLLTGSAGNTGVQFAPSGGFADLRFTTSDGADSKVMRIGGGGDVLTSRGALLTLQGNEGGGEAVLSAGDGGNYILLQNGNVGVNAGAPATRLEVNGDAQFGSGAAKSTFTATGNLQLVAGSTIATNGTLSVSTAASAGATGTPALFVDLGGRTGLATAAPARTLDVVGDAQFGSGAGKSVFTTAGALAIAAGASVALSGSGGTIATGSSVTASAFFGDGAGLTNVAGGNLQAGSVDTSKLATDAVINVKILTGSVDTRTLATDAVVTAKILDGAVQTAKLATDSVSSVKLLNDSGSLTKVSGGAMAASAGNVGIGATTPAQKLEINSGNLLLQRHGSNSNSLFMGVGASDGSFVVGNAGGFIEIQNIAEGGNSSQAMHFQTHFTGNSAGRRMTIDKSGNVGIGTESPVSGDKLTLVGNLGLGSGGQVRLRNADNSATGFIFNNGVTGQSDIQIQTTGGIDRVTIKNSGDVGIGTTSPGYRADVSGHLRVGGVQASATTGAGIELAYTGSVGVVDVFDRGGGGIRKDLNIQSNALYVKSSGNVGIGSSAPSQKLQVSSGTLMLDGTGAKLETSGNTALLAACQGGGAPVVTGTDIAGKLNVGATPGTDCTITFQTPYANPPICVASNETAANAVRPVSTATTLKLIGTLGAGDVINYICVGRR